MMSAVIISLFLFSFFGVKDSLGSAEIDAVKQRLDALEAGAKTYLTASDFVNAEVKVKVLDLKLLDEKDCPTGWKKLENSCYHFGKDQLNWNGAKDKCIKLGGHLVKIESSKENKMLSTEAGKAGLTEGDIWTGANDISNEGTWRWVSDNSRVHYKNWYPREPNDTGGEDCGIIWIRHDFKWNDGECSYPHGYYICEKEL